MNLEKLEEYWKQLEEILDKIQELHEKFMKEFSVDKIESIFYPITREKIHYKKILDILARLVIRATTSSLNININVSEIKEKLKEFKDIQKVVEYINDKYIKHADEIAFNQILERARKLLPLNPSIEQILKGNKLILRHYCNLRDPAPYLGDFLNSATALEELAIIVLKQERPSTVHPCYDIFNTYWNLDPQTITEKKQLPPGNPIRAVKLYKNGRVDFWFETPEDARKVAEVLINGKI